MFAAELQRACAESLDPGVLQVMRHRHFHRVSIRPLPGDADPASATFEITVRAQGFAPREYGLGYIRVSGFTFERAADGGFPRGFEYVRDANPNCIAFEACMAALEGGAEAVAFASGMAAISAVIEAQGLPWHVVRVGARVEFICAPGPLRNGSEAEAAHAGGGDLEEAGPVGEGALVLVGEGVGGVPLARGEEVREVEVLVPRDRVPHQQHPPRRRPRHQGG
jgi:hypothetical protein